ncbi:MAG: hypothetical protein H6817_03535 [Phycisphaerales bacterium]|nr:hypothetical protein [Phycisphaerales bacterium]
MRNRPIADRSAIKSSTSRARSRCLSLFAGALCVSILTGCASRPITADLAYFPKNATAHVVHLKTFNALDDLVRVGEHWTDTLRGGLASPFVARPAGIAYRDNHLYICDPGANVVHDWDLESGKARKLGNGDDLAFGKPVAVAADADGNVYVADADRGDIVAIAPGADPHRFNAGRDAYRPVAIAARPGALLAADVAAHQIDVFDIPGGAARSSFGGVGSDAGKLYYPAGVAVDGAGNIFVSDMMNSRVQGFTPDGSPLISMGQPGDRYGDMGKPRHLAVGPDGVIFVADPEFSRVHVFNAQGQLLMLLGEDEGIGATPMPVGVAVAESLPPGIAALVPDNFEAQYYLFVANSLGEKHISLYAIGIGLP